MLFTQVQDPSVIILIISFMILDIILGVSYIILWFINRNKTRD